MNKTAQRILLTIGAIAVVTGSILLARMGEDNPGDRALFLARMGHAPDAASEVAVRTDFGNPP